MLRALPASSDGRSEAPLDVLATEEVEAAAPVRPGDRRRRVERRVGREEVAVEGLRFLHDRRRAEVGKILPKGLALPEPRWGRWVPEPGQGIGRAEAGKAQRVFVGSVRQLLALAQWRRRARRRPRVLTPRGLRQGRSTRRAGSASLP